jgi:hypothetical protein
MKESTLHVLGGFALIGGGMFTAMFWILAADVGSFLGADSVRHPLWAPSQWFHVLGALLTLFGLIALYGAQRAGTGVATLTGFALAIMGTVLFFADGFVGLVIFPALARSAPWVLSRTGVMNSGTVLTAFTLSAVVNLMGLTVFALAMLRDGLFPRTALMLFLAGGALFNLPPGPLPMLLLALGGVIWAAGAIWLGLALQAHGHGHATDGWRRLGIGS